MDIIEAANKRLLDLIFKADYLSVPPLLLEYEKLEKGTLLPRILNYPLKNTPLYVVCRGSNDQPVCTSTCFLPIVQLLIEKGADVNAKMPDTRSTALHSASFRGRLDVMILLVRYGAKLSLNQERDTPVEDARDPQFGSTLHRALAIKILLSIVSETDDKYETNLPYGEEEIKSINIDIQGMGNIREDLVPLAATFVPNRWSALHHACVVVNSKAFRQIVDHNSATKQLVNAPDKDGWTPLHVLVARYITYGSDNPTKQAEVLSMISYVKNGMWNWHARVATPDTYLRHPLAFQCFVCDYPDAQSVLYFRPQRLHWPYDVKKERLAAKRWTDSSPPDGEDIQAFFTLTEQCRLRIFRVDSVNNDSVCGRQIHSDLVVSPKGIAPLESLTNPDSGWYGTSDQFVEVPSLMPHYTVSVENPIFYGHWAIAGLRFAFKGIRSVEPTKEEYDVAFDGAKHANGVLVLTRDDTTTAVINGFYVAENRRAAFKKGCGLQDLTRLHPETNAEVHASVNFGPALLHWIEGVDPLQKLVPETDYTTSLCRQLTDIVGLKAPSSNVHNAMYLAFAANPNGWGTKLFHAYGITSDDECVALFLLHSMCAVGDCTHLKSLFEKCKVMFPNLVNTPRECTGGRVEYAVVVAASFGHINVVVTLVEYFGADPHVGEDSALRKAIANGNTQVAEWLLKKGFKPFLTLPSEGKVPTLEELTFVEDNNVLSDNGREKVLRENVHEWCKTDDRVGDRQGGANALVLVGLQKDFARGKTGMEEFVAKVCAFISFARASFDYIVCLTDEHSTVSGADHCLADTDGVKLIPEIEEVLKSVSSSTVFYVSTFIPGAPTCCSSGFFDDGHSSATMLHRTLQKLHVLKLVMCGMGLDCFLRRTVEDAMRLDYSVHVVMALSLASRNGIDNTAPLRACGAKVITKHETDVDDDHWAEVILLHANIRSHCKEVKRSPIVEKILSKLLNHAGVRLHVVFEGSVNAARFLQVLDGYDFGMEPRNGEIFLYLAMLMNRTYEAYFDECCANNTSIDHEKHTFGLHSFTIEGVQFNSGDYHALGYPLHYLMMRSKFSSMSGIGDSVGCERLLKKCICFINSATEKGALDVLGQHTTQLPGGKRPRDLGTHYPLVPCTLKIPNVSMMSSLDRSSAGVNVTRCKCIFHVPVRPVFIDADDSIHSLWREGFDYKEAKECSCDDAPHTLPERYHVPTSHQVSHLLCCTPLMLAVRLGLPEIVSCMVTGGVVTTRVEKGRDWNGAKFGFDVLEDIWECLPFRQTAAGEVVVTGCPPLHLALRTVQCVTERLAGSSPVNFLRLVKPGGCAVCVKKPAPPAPTTSSSRRSEARWLISTEWQWVCQKCGTSPMGGAATSDLAWLASMRCDLIEVCRVLIRASLTTKRLIQVHGDTVPVITMRLGDRRVRVSSTFDRCGVFEMFERGCGLSLTLQYAPELLSTLLECDFLRTARFENFTALCQLLKWCDQRVRLRRRHLWTVCGRGGMEIDVVDNDLTLLHWAALYDSVELVTHLADVFGLWMEEKCFEAKTKYLGYTPIHYACYASATRMLTHFADCAADAFDIQTVERFVNAPAMPIVVGPRTITLAEVARLRKVKKTGEVSSHDMFNSIGETAAHVASSFGHAECLEILLENGCDVTAKTFAEDMDPHDIALALHAKHERQMLTHHLLQTSRTQEDVERSRQVSEIVDRTVFTLQQTPKVGKKLRRHSSGHFIRETVPYAIYLVCLILFGFLLMNEHVTNGSYLFISSMQDRISGEAFVLDFSTSPTHPPLGTQFKATIGDVGSLGDVGLWLSQSFRRIFFDGAKSDVVSPRALWEEGKYLLVGSARIGVLLSKSSLCTVIDTFKSVIPTCYSHLDPNNIDKSDILLSDGRRAPYGIWNELSLMSRLGSISPTTNLWYPPSQGNFIDVGPGNFSQIENSFKGVMEMLKVSTRYVTAQFIVYNVNLDMYIAGEINFEIPISGGVRVSQTYRYLRAHYYEFAPDWLRLATEFILLFFIAIFLHEEAIDICYTAYDQVMHFRANRKRHLDELAALEADTCPDKGDLGISHFRSLENLLDKEHNFSGQYPTQTLHVHYSTPVAILIYLHKGFQVHFWSDWNGIDMPILILLMSSMVVHIDGIVHDVEWDGSAGTFPNNLHAVAFNHMIEINLISVCILFSCIKLLKYVRLMPTLGPIALAIGVTATHKSIVTFVTVFSIVMIGIVIACYTAFSPYISQMRSFKTTFFFVFRMIVGDTDFDALERGHDVLGPFIWILCVGFVTILLLNILIAIVGNVYNDVIIEAEVTWNIMIAESYCETNLFLPPLSRPHGNFMLRPFVSLVGRFFPSVRGMAGGTVMLRTDDEKEWEYVSSRVIELSAETQKNKELTNDDLLQEIKALRTKIESK